MGVCFDHADSFEIDHFDQYFHLVFWLKVNNDTVFEAIVLEYDRYEPPLGAMLSGREYHSQPSVVNPYSNSFQYLQLFSQMS